MKRREKRRWIPLSASAVSKAPKGYRIIARGANPGYGSWRKLHLLLLSVFIGWSTGCAVQKSNRNWAEKDPGELITALSSGNWREREAAQAELFRKGRDAAGAGVFQAFEQARDARLRDRLTAILHEWGLFAVDRRTLAKALNQLEQVVLDLEEQIPRIRTSDAWMEAAGEHLRADSGAATHILDGLGDENARRFREEIVLRVNKALILLRQEQKEQTIAALAGLVRLLREKIEEHRSLLQE